jgi:PAS domain S-box-containing protein
MRAVRRFGFAVLAVAGATGLRLLLDPILLNHVPFITFFFAVYLASLFGGLGAGLFATVLSAAAGAYFIAEPRFSLYLSNSGDVLQLALFLMVGSAISVSNDRVRAAHSSLKQAAAQLEHRNLVMNMALTAALSGSWELDLRTGRLVWDEASNRLYGLGAEYVASLRTFYSLIHPDDVDRVRQDIDNCRNRRISGFQNEYRMMLPKGVRYIEGRAQVDYDGFGRPLRVVGIASDVTEKRLAEGEQERLEVQLRDARHLESVGRSAGGVAHDFNNLLTVINGYSETLSDHLGLQDPLRSCALQIRKAGSRAADLVGQLLAFSQKQIIRPRAMDLNEFLCETEGTLRWALGNRDELVLNLGPNVGPVVADPAQVQRVLADLIAHAREAMPDGGRVEIATTNCDLASGEAGLVDAEPGPYVRMTITDSGAGIAPERLQHIFEPFFQARKRRGVGTGIGLATVYGIVRQSRGWIDVRSELGRGTSFRVYLPRVDELRPPQEVARCLQDSSDGPFRDVSSPGVTPG